MPREGRGFGNVSVVFENLWLSEDWEHFGSQGGHCFEKGIWRLGTIWCLRIRFGDMFGSHGDSLFWKCLGDLDAFLGVS